MSIESLFDAAEACLAAIDVDKKLALTQEMAQAWRDGRLNRAWDLPPTPIGEPGRPTKPQLVPPAEVPQPPPPPAPSCRARRSDGGAGRR